ncbi:MAG: hypothetical protein GY723_05850 [bacterium]|nr:hypothetical protein [bacterium]
MSGVKAFLRRLAVYAFRLFFAKPVLGGLAGVSYRRAHLVPKGPCLVVSNHNSHLDAAVLMGLFSLRRLPHVHPVAAADYFGKSWFMNMMAMWFMNGIPIERRPPAGTDPLSPLSEQIRQGESLIFFPEGSRGKAGVVAKFRPGIGMLVKRNPGLLVVPVFLSGPERIWPRGEVPVPLSSIDAHVGRPRTYSADLDARVIAERVREDVLALAPPPPPVPGPPPAPPSRVAICGIDGDVRGAIVRATVERLGSSGHTVGIGSGTVEADGNGVRESSGPAAFGLSKAWLRVLAGLFRTRGGFRGDRFVEMVERAKVNEVLQHGHDTRFVVVEGSALADLPAWSEADTPPGTFDEAQLNRMIQYVAGQKDIRAGLWWRYIRQAREVWLVNVFNLVKAPVPDLVVLLTTQVPTLMEKLRSRGTELEDYETETFMERLDEAYRRIVTVLRKRHRAQVLEIDPAGLDPKEIAAKIETAARGQV